MQISKAEFINQNSILKKFSKCRLVFTAIVLFSCSLNFLFGQSMPDMPDFPTISSPTLGSDFYKPKVPYYPKNPEAPVKPDSKNSNGTNQNTNTFQTTTLSDGNSQQNILNDLLGNNNFLTASDITALSNTGLFNSLPALSSSNDSVSTNTLLKQILSELDELKKNTNTSSSNVSSNQNFKNRDARILRFKINGYDIKDSLTTVYFSQLENDGSFLLSGDRRYVADKKIHNETFYFLFKAKENSGSIITYEVSPSIMQDTKNENSFVYKLAQKKSLTAQKTGNLVVLRVEAKDCFGDLLLDLDI